MYDEELSLHKNPLHLAQYLNLPSADRQSDNIYFIDDIISDSELLQTLIDKVDELRNDLIEAGIISGGR